MRPTSAHNLRTTRNLKLPAFLEAKPLGKLRQKPMGAQGLPWGEAKAAAPWASGHSVRRLPVRISVSFVTVRKMLVWTAYSRDRWLVFR